MKLSKDKVTGMEAISDDRGVIAAAAMDQRGSLKKALAAARRTGGVTAQEVEAFKVFVTQVLTPHASAIDLDPEYGLPASRHRAPGVGLVLAYEKSGYDNSQPGRLPDLLPHESVRRLKEQGADAVKILIYYSPFEKSQINDIKHAFVERVGDECRAVGIPFLLEFVGYDVDGGDEKGLDYARRKPEIVTRSITEFCQARYGADALKVEVPVSLKFVSGSDCFQGVTAYSRDEALECLREAGAAASRPFIYLSGGVSNAEFTEALSLAAEAGVPFSGVMCGRATWADGIPVFADAGPDAFRHWLETQGVANIQKVNACLDAAVPWYRLFGAESADAVVAA